MDKVAAGVREQFEGAGFRSSGDQGSRLRFENDFAVYFVFFFAETKQLQASWQECHAQLIDDYRTLKGSRAKEWNYYAMFVVKAKGIDEDLAGIRHNIESNTSYSRKFVFRADRIPPLPPGVVSDAGLQPTASGSTTPYASWSSTLGNGLLSVVLDGPKNKVETRLSNYLDKHAT